METIAMAGQCPRTGTAALGSADWRSRLALWLESAPVQRGIVLLILINAAIFGLETSPSVMTAVGPALLLADRVILAVFVAELSLRLLAFRWRFFRDPWSVFDLAVVLVALLPATGSLSALRALRVLRVLRLITVLPQLRAVVSGLLRAIPGLSSIAGLLCLVLYVAAVIATKLYGATSPELFGTLGASLLTLFQVMTLEGWADILRDVMGTHPTAWLFFISFMLVTTFTVLNLFIAVIVEGMQSAKLSSEAGTAEDRASNRDGGDVASELAGLREDLRVVMARIDDLGRRTSLSSADVEAQQR